MFYNQACFLLIRNEADPEVLAESDSAPRDEADPEVLAESEPAPRIRNEADPEVLAESDPALCDETEADSLEKKEELGIPKYLDGLENVAKHYSSR